MAKTSSKTPIKRIKRAKPVVRTADESEFYDFISDKQILIADSSHAMRGSIAKLLKGMGAQTKNMRFAMDFPSALNELESLRPHVVVTDYYLGKDCGLKLIEPHRALALDDAERENSLFIVITSNTEQSAVAEAAEEEVDAYVLKPFSIRSFKDHFINAVLQHNQPNPYMAEIRKGKLAFAKGEIEKAEGHFEMALQLTSLPSLAHYYLGITYEIQDDLRRAEMSYRKGLEIRPKHLRCTLGLMENLFEQARFEESYRYANELLSTYTLSPSRLEIVIHLAVKNRAFDDIPALYEIFRGIEYRSHHLTQSMIAALVVSGKNSIQENKARLAEKLFENAISLSHRSTSVLRRIVMAWIDIQEFGRAEKVLQLFPPSTHSEGIYEILHFLIFNGTASAVDSINAGLSLLKNGVKSPELYETLIRRMIDTGRHRGAESLAFEAASSYENQREKFLKLIST